MVITKDGIYFVLKTETTTTTAEKEVKTEVMDYIPMHQISTIYGNEPMESANNTPNFTKSENKKKIKKTETFQGTHDEIQIKTENEGYNSGRIYRIKLADEEKCVSALGLIKQFSSRARSRAAQINEFQKTQQRVSSFYRHPLFQSIATTLILAVKYLILRPNLCHFNDFPFLLVPAQNFGLNIYAAQIAAIDEMNQMQATDSTSNILNQTDLIFVLFFTFELAVNLYANWFQRFLANPWSIFDFLIVAISLLGLAPIGMPLSLLLLFRCCRVLRVFGRFPTVSGIFSALAKSVVPMASTFFIVFILSSIC